MEEQGNPYRQEASPSRERRRPADLRSSIGMEHIPIIALCALGTLAILGLVILGFSPGETESIRTTLATVTLASVAAIAGLVKGGSA